MPGTMPLTGVRVLDLGRVFAAPLCTQTLADLGADVIKVERPGRGDEMRYYGPPFAQDEDGNDLPMSSYYLAANRNKRSICVDFTTPEGQSVIRDLAAVSDVCVENYKVGDLARYGLDYAGLRAVNDQLIYCSITGFGQTGPYAERPATDSVFQAMSGLMSVTGEPDGPPQRAGIIVADIIAGTNAVAAILAALRHREINGGAGQHIDVALLDVAVASMSHRAIEYMLSGVVPHRLGTRQPGSAPAQVFRCKDGEINFQASADPKFRTLAKLLGRPEIAEDPRFVTRARRYENVDELQTTIEDILKDWTVRDLYEALIAAGLVASPVYSLDQTFRDPQVVHRGLQRTVADGAIDLPMLSHPIVYSETPVTRYDAPRAIGSDTDAVLQSVLEYAPDRIAALRTSGVL